jgi:hypothetical protein
MCVGPALDLETAGVGSVHSVFAHAVNLIVRGDLWTLLADGRGDLPFGIRVRLSNFDAIGLCSGDRVCFRVGFVGIGSRLVVDCRAAPRWAPAGKQPCQPGLRRRLAVLARMARGRSWHDSARMAQALRSAANNTNTLEEVLAHVVGRGPGATPSGDDVLVGVLAVLTSPHAGEAGAAASTSLCRALLPLLPTTTDVSGHLLRQAAEGLLSRDLQELVSALLVGQASRLPNNGRREACPTLKDKIRRVLEAGATSGADTCEGLLAFAPSYFERASA